MSRDILIGEGYIPGLIGQVTLMHAAFYSQWAGFGAVFECKVAGDLAEFVTRVERPGNAVWYATRLDEIVGSIAIDGEDLDDGCAHLRWFMVDPKRHGAGIGMRLLDQALKFADQEGFEQVHLWTLKGLDAARELYERQGFVLADEYRGDQWGADITEQKFIRVKSR